MDPISAWKGRGTALNPISRFEKLSLEGGDYVQHSPEDEAPSPRTIFYKDPSRTVLSKNDSPDVGFRYSVNPYRGCGFGCTYCYAAFFVPDDVSRDAWGEWVEVKRNAVETVWLQASFCVWPIRISGTPNRLAPDTLSFPGMVRCDW